MSDDYAMLCIQTRLRMEIDNQIQHYQQKFKKFQPQMHKKKSKLLYAVFSMESVKYDAEKIMQTFVWTALLLTTHSIFSALPAFFFSILIRQIISDFMATISAYVLLPLITYHYINRLSAKKYAWNDIILRHELLTLAMIEGLLTGYALSNRTLHSLPPFTALTPSIGFITLQLLAVDNDENMTSLSFAERTLSKNTSAPLPSSSSSSPSTLTLPSLLPTDLFMSTIPFPVTLIRGDKLQMVNLQLQLTSNESVIKDILSSKEYCDNVLLICFACAGRYFHVIFCSAPNGFNRGDQLTIPSKWQSLCKTANKEEANIWNGIVLRPIEFGQEIIICNEPETLTLEPSKMLQNDKEGQQLEMIQQGLTHAEHIGGYKCDRCGKMFTYEYYREKHLKYTRCVDHGDRKFRCSICPRSFEKRDRLRIHVLHVHENHRPHVCSTCGKSFSQSSSLNKHFRVHSGERPYKCIFCSKSFTASSILRTHVRQHSGEKPFQCANCGKSFASHAAHDSHVRRTHQEQTQLQLQLQLQQQHLQQKQQQCSIYRCQMCQKTFEHQLHLNFHQHCVHSLTVS
ncbi:unnamed protein product [Brugia pahangi]|uniref:Zinc finger protein n=1 Tax=Brugia pahangi TaxID=6280 RepID=A0A0N4TPH2_BRUPA|nr:unnamed protein product [Brugia pahangi]